MRNEIVIEILKKEIEENLGKLWLLFKKKEYISEKYRFYWLRINMMCFKFVFLV